MPNFLYTLSDVSIFLLMIVITVSFSLFFIGTNKILKIFKFPYKDNTTIASVASLIGIIYGVLTGLICLYLLNNQDHAAKAALDEGTAAANIYRQSRWLKDPQKKLIQIELKKYITNVIHDEWPAMTEGKVVSMQNAQTIFKMSDQLATYPLRTQTDVLAVSALVHEMNALYQGRQERIEMGGSQLSQDVWDVILLSTFLIMIINYAFRVDFKLHLFSLTVFAMMAASVLFMLATLDRPFQGEFIVAPDALQRVLILMEQDKK